VNFIEGVDVENFELLELALNFVGNDDPELMEPDCVVAEYEENLEPLRLVLHFVEDEELKLERLMLAVVDEIMVLTDLEVGLKFVKILTQMMGHFESRF